MTWSKKHMARRYQDNRVITIGTQYARKLDVRLDRFIKLDYNERGKMKRIIRISFIKQQNETAGWSRNITKQK